jgi:hypothetical protein
MTRSDFFKVFGFTLISPTILTSNAKGEIIEETIETFKPKRWPIYPDKIEMSFKEPSNAIQHTVFTFVKIERNNSQFLIPVREHYFGDKHKMIERFEWNVKKVQESFIVDELRTDWFDNGFIIRYDPNIHKN